MIKDAFAYQGQLASKPKTLNIGRKLSMITTLQDQASKLGFQSPSVMGYPMPAMIAPFDPAAFSAT